MYMSVREKERESVHAWMCVCACVCACACVCVCVSACERERERDRESERERMSENMLKCADMLRRRMRRSWCICFYMLHVHKRRCDFFSLAFTCMSVFVFYSLVITDPRK